MPVVGVWPWRTSSTSVDLGADRWREVEQRAQWRDVGDSPRDPQLFRTGELVVNRVHDDAYDPDTGEELWAMPLPGNIGSEGLPAMYEEDGKQYLVVSATTPHPGLGGPSVQGAPSRYYVAFALPDGQ